MDPFAAETYICLDLPSPVAEHVLSIRRAQGDLYRSALPAEITVAGSGGLGVVAPGQDPHSVFTALDRVAAATPPITARFGPVVRFPQTDTFVLTLSDDMPFRALQRRLETSGIRFTASPFPFTPHCTLRSHAPVSESEVNALLSLRMTERFTLNTLTIYALMGLPMTRLHAASLTGHQA